MCRQQIARERAHGLCLGIDAAIGLHNRDVGDDIADAARDGDPAPPPDVATLGFLVSGYDDAGVGEAWEVTLPGRAVEQIATTTNGGGAAWRGQSDVVTRMVRGADLELLVRLAAVNEKYRPGFTLPALPALREPVTVIVPAGWFRAGRVIELYEQSSRQIRLTQQLDRGSDFERCAFDGL